MSEEFLVVVLALAWFTVTNAVAGLVAALLGRLVSPLFRSNPARAARLFLALKILPGVVSIVFTLCVFLPSHWRFEPAGAEESAGLSLVLVALAGALLLAVTFRHAWRDTRVTRAIARHWRAMAQAIPPVADSLVPVFTLPDPRPVISLVGIRRPVLFVAETVRAALTPEELEVSLAHEAAHVRAWDNLKRMIVAWSPDVLEASGLSRGVRREWEAAMEFAADATAARGSERRALELASALIKVARLAPTRGLAAAPAGSRLHDESLLAARVERLLATVPLSVTGAPMPPWAVAALAVPLLVALLPTHAWPAVHAATETLVRLLP